MTRRPVDWHRRAADHQATLAVLGAIVRLLEADVHSTARRTAGRIANLCQAEMQRQLRAMDKARERAARRRR